MPKRSDWITVKEAAAILTQNSGHPVNEAYVRRLGAAGTLETWQVDGRTKLYKKVEVEHYLVKQRGDGSVRRTVRKDAREKAAREQEKSESAA